MRSDALLLGESHLTRLSTTVRQPFMLKIIHVVKNVEVLAILGALCRPPS
jgi:hypothetical protein